MSVSIDEVIASQVKESLKTRNRVIFAVSGPQGSGKTTVTMKSAERLQELGIPTTAVSIDDFYKPFDELQQIATGKNPLLRHRGLPGTHDVDLMEQFLSEFLRGRPFKVPVYDKSCHNGAGDRVGYREVSTSTVAVLLEGWMVGFNPVKPESLVQKIDLVTSMNLSIAPSLDNYTEINNNLKMYVRLWDACNEFVVLKAEDLALVYQWREQQEQGLREKKGEGMTKSQVKEFVDQYMPCYIIYNDTLPVATVFTINREHKVKQVV